MTNNQSQGGSQPTRPRKKGRASNGSKPHRPRQASLPPKIPVTPSSGDDTTKAPPDVFKRPWYRRLLVPWGNGRARNSAITAAWIGVIGTTTPVLVPYMADGIDWLTATPGRTSYSTPVVTIVHARKSGIKAYAGPGSKGYGRPVRILHNGEIAQVECVLPAGEPVFDPGSGRPAGAVAVWDKLADGSWISDIYTNLPGKRTDGQAPRNVRQCTEADIHTPEAP